MAKQESYCRVPGNEVRVALVEQERSWHSRVGLDGWGKHMDNVVMAEVQLALWEYPSRVMFPGVTAMFPWPDDTWSFWFHDPLSQEYIYFLLWTERRPRRRKKEHPLHIASRSRLVLCIEVLFHSGILYGNAINDGRQSLARWAWVTGAALCSSHESLHPASCNPGSEIGS